MANSRRGRVAASGSPRQAARPASPVAERATGSSPSILVSRAVCSGRRAGARAAPHPARRRHRTRPPASTCHGGSKTAITSGASPISHGEVETVEATVVQVRQFASAGAAGSSSSRPRLRTAPACSTRRGTISRTSSASSRRAPVVLHGRVQRQGGEVQIIAPEFEVIDPDEETLHIGASSVYPGTDGLTQRALRTVVSRAFDDMLRAAGVAAACASAAIRLPTSGVAPAGPFFRFRKRQLRPAPRFVFEELLLLQLLLLRQKAAAEAEPRGVLYGDAPDLSTVHGQPPVLVDASHGSHRRYLSRSGDADSHESSAAGRRRVRQDRGRRSPLPVCSVGGGAQGAVMAPTEILAGQHYLTLGPLLEPLGVTVVLLVGGVAGGASDAFEQVRDSPADIVIGTHARSSRTLSRSNGWGSWSSTSSTVSGSHSVPLCEKGVRPDVLVMTATPIPRTLRAHVVR